MVSSSAGTNYAFDWRLITHPKDYSGEMEGKKSKTLKLSQVSRFHSSMMEVYMWTPLQAVSLPVCDSADCRTVRVWRDGDRGGRPRRGLRQRHCQTRYDPKNSWKI